MGVFFIFLACATWAFDTLIRYPLLSKSSALQIVSAEHFILTIIFTPYLFKYSKRMWNAKLSHLFSFFVIGSMGSAIGTLAFTAAFAKINPSLVILLQKLQPVVAITLAWLVLKEPLKKKFILWGIVCLLGSFLMSYRDIAPGLLDFDFSISFDNNEALLGYGLALLAVISWGASTVFGKKLEKEGYKVFDIMSGRFLFGLLVLIPLMFSQGEEIPRETDFWKSVLTLVVISGLVGMWFYYKGLKKISARLCTLAEMFFPFCAIAVNWIFLEKTLDSTQLIGGGILLMGSTVLQLKRY